MQLFGKFQLTGAIAKEVFEKNKEFLVNFCFVNSIGTTNKYYWVGGKAYSTNIAMTLTTIEYFIQTFFIFAKAVFYEKQLLNILPPSFDSFSWSRSCFNDAGIMAVFSVQYIQWTSHKNFLVKSLNTAERLVKLILTYQEYQYPPKVPKTPHRF